jgi:hypothetical protein
MAFARHGHESESAAHFILQSGPDALLQEFQSLSPRLSLEIDQ